MIEPDQGQLRVELQRESVDDRGALRYTAWAEGRLLGSVTGSVDQGRLRIVVDDEVVATGSAERRALLAAVAELAGTQRLSGVVLGAGAHLLLRHEARTLRFSGSLRGDLTGDLTGRVGAPELTPGGGAPLQDAFLSDLRALLPGVAVLAADRRAGRLRSLLRSASSGVAGTIHLTAQHPSHGEPLRVAVPLGDDIMAEGVALAIDTALAVRRAFHPLVDRVRIFYDHAIQGLRTGTVGGVAEASVRDIHLNPAYALVSEMEALDRDLRQRRSQSPVDGRRPPITVLPPFTRIDSVVAHEFWHQIEFGFEGGRYRDSVDFRRAVGGYFGVETLEHVIKGAAAGAPASWQAARVRLAEQVSAYATTAPKEATAELFTQWWCTAAAPPPSARAFGELLSQFFPAADLVR